MVKFIIKLIINCELKYFKDHHIESKSQILIKFLKNDF